MKPGRAYLLCGTLAVCGCAAPALRSQSPEEELDAIGSKVRLVGEVARPYGLNYIKIESVGLVVGLDATGEDPAPSGLRSLLLHEMQKRGVTEPNKLLQSPNTALVLVRAFLPPGVQRGDKLDLEVQVPKRSETTSLRGGWLMDCRLTEMEVLGNQIHDGHILASGEGAVLVDPSADGEKDKGLLVRGRILGGGTALKPRPLGLVIGTENKSIRLSSQIGAAINKRFHTFEHGAKKGMATPKTDEFIEINLHPRYKDNISRYMRVVRSVPIKESTTEQVARLKLLERQLIDHVTAATAALRLEALGHDGVKTLLQGIGEQDPEVRFYSAEALAYLDEKQAAAPLAAAARQEPAFRAYALAALSAMDDISAYDELRGLLDVTSVETRYGAFRALWAMNANDPLVKGEELGGKFGYHVLKTAGPALIHVTRSYRPEIVLFGENQRFESPLSLEAGKSIVINSVENDQVAVSRFAVGQPDQRHFVLNRVDEVIKKIVELGGTYPDVVQALQQAKAARSLASRFAVDAIPSADRQYQRRQGLDGDETPGNHFEIANPLPELFSLGGGKTHH